MYTIKAKQLVAGCSALYGSEEADYLFNFQLPFIPPCGFRLRHQGAIYTIQEIIFNCEDCSVDAWVHPVR